MYFADSVQMSALGQKQTFAVHKRRSALAPKADICSALGDVRSPEADVRFGPHSDSCSAAKRVVIRSPRRLAAAESMALTDRAPWPSSG